MEKLCDYKLQLLDDNCHGRGWLNLGYATISHTTLASQEIAFYKDDIHTL